jgi:hypothetical protein
VVRDSVRGTQHRVELEREAIRMRGGDPSLAHFFPEDFLGAIGEPDSTGEVLHSLIECKIMISLVSLS